MIKSRRKRKQLGMKKATDRVRFTDAATMFFEMFGRYPNFNKVTKIAAELHYAKNNQLK